MNICMDCGCETDRCSRAQGIKIRCIPCHRKNAALRTRVWYQANRERALASEKRRQLADVEAFRKNARDKYSRMTEEARKARQATMTKWRKENKDLVRISNRKANAKKRENPKHRLDMLMESFAKKTIRYGRDAKTGLVAYTGNDLRRHLEAQFRVGMSWENYGRGAGRWQIDHIIPKSSYMFQSHHDCEFQECWSLLNLRPLWEWENNAKGSAPEILPLPMRAAS